MLNDIYNFIFQYLAPPALLLGICVPLTLGKPSKNRKLEYPETQGLKALSHLKDWSNYLLITTVAILGWIATGPAHSWPSSTLKWWCMWSFALSLVFGIFTLALIPLVTEIYKGGKSIYTVYPHFDLLGGGSGTRRIRIKHLCRPQHVLFIIGIFLFLIGSTDPSPNGLLP